MAHFETRLTPLRVTLIGHAQAGKTSLVSAFVNNFCPTVYAETLEVTLYYKSMELPGTLDTPPFPVLLEIEDTYGWKREDLGHWDDEMFTAPYAGSPHSSSGKAADAPGYPFAAHPPPEAQAPLVDRRMGFIIVFDAADRSSLDAAEEAGACFKRESGHNLRNREDELPIFVVARKVDRASPSADEHANIQAAQKFAKEHRMFFAIVCPSDFKEVRKLFRHLLNEIRARPHLWAPDSTPRGSHRGRTPQSQSARHTWAPSMPTMPAMLRRPGSQAGGQQGAKDCVLQ